MKYRTSFVLVLICCGSLSAGCANKVQECNQVADIVNTNVDALHETDKKLHATTDPEQEAKLAEGMIELVRQASKDLSALELKTEGLRPLVTAYTDMLGQIEAAGTEILGHVAKAEGVTEQKVKESFQSLEKALETLSKACATPSEDCNALSAILDKFPRAPKDSEIVSAFNTLSSNLKKLEVKDESVKAAAEKFMGVVEDKVALLEKAQELQAALETTEKKLDSAIEAEDKVVSQLNQFCGAA